MDPESHYFEFAAAYARGKLVGTPAESDALWDDDASAVRAAQDAGLRLHRFKRTAGLARVRKVLGALRSFAPSALLDIGSGRGAFLWPVLDQCGHGHTRVVAIDRLDYRVADIQAVRRGGIDHLLCARMDVGQLGFADQSFDVVTILEVLEHLRDPAQAAAEAVRVARRAVIASVPSKEDDNPEHIQLFERDSLERLLLDAGARRVSVDFVLNHMVAVARC